MTQISFNTGTAGFNQPPRSALANPAGSVLKIVRLQREGTLAKGDTVATDVLGECEVVSVPAYGSLRVLRHATGELITIGGIDFPPRVTMRVPDPRDSIQRV